MDKSRVYFFVFHSLYNHLSDPTDERFISNLEFAIKSAINRPIVNIH